jgi:ABC-type polysaccharide/polyol phosphate export permease
MWLVFSRLFHASIPGDVPYIVYALAGNIAVIYFQQGVSMTSASLTSSSGILTKLYVPPAIFAFSTSLSGAVNFLYSLVPLLIFQLALGPRIAWTLVLIPIPLLFLIFMIAGIGLFIATFTILFDDILNFVNVFLTLFSYVTPIFYPITIVPARYQRLFYLNPIFPYVGILRHLAYGGPATSWFSWLYIVLSGIVGFSLGLTIFVHRWPKVAVHL